MFRFNLWGIELCVGGFNLLLLTHNIVNSINYDRLFGLCLFPDFNTGLFFAGEPRQDPTLGRSVRKRPRLHCLAVLLLFQINDEVEGIQGTGPQIIA